MPRRLTDDERALWQQVVRDATPLEPGRRRLREASATAPAPAPSPASAPPAAPAIAPDRPAEPRVAVRPEKPTRTQMGPAARVGVDLAPHPVEALATAPLRMDAGLHRRLQRGRIAPETRIDLHGLTLEQARAALTGFLLAAQARGQRLVLVITGKGRTAPDNPPGALRKPGALRQELPHWLRLPPLRERVLDIRPAHRSHGGDGAFYVVLRRPR